MSGVKRQVQRRRVMKAAAKERNRTVNSRNYSDGALKKNQLFRMMWSQVNKKG